MVNVSEFVGLWRCVAIVAACGGELWSMLECFAMWWCVAECDRLMRVWPIVAECGEFGGEWQSVA